MLVCSFDTYDVAVDPLAFDSKRRRGGGLTIQVFLEFGKVYNEMSYFSLMDP